MMSSGNSNGEGSLTSVEPGSANEVLVAVPMSVQTARVKLYVLESDAEKHPGTKRTNSALEKTDI